MVSLGEEKLSSTYPSIVNIWGDQGPRGVEPELGIDCLEAQPKGSGLL